MLTHGGIFMEFIQTFDISVLRYLSNIAEPTFVTPLMRFITSLGDAGFIWLLIAAICLIKRKTRPCGFAMLMAIAISGVIGNLGLKPLVARPRPFSTYSDLIPLIASPKDFSFPSGHTLASFAGAVSLFCYYRKTGVAALFLAFAIGFSRMYVGVHYPSDVLVGAILGTCFALLSVKVMRSAAIRIHYNKLRR